MCNLVDARTDAAAVVMYCTQTDVAFAMRARYAKTASGRDTAQIAMAVLGIKIAVAYLVLGNESKSNEWIATSRRLLTHVARSGANGQNRKLVKQYLDQLPDSD